MILDREHRARAEVEDVGPIAHRPLAHPLAGEGAPREIPAVALVGSRDALIVGDGGVAALRALDERRARLVMVLLVERLGRGGGIGLAREGQRRAAKVVVADRVRAGPHLERDPDLADELAFGGLVGLVDEAERHRARRAALEAVSEDEG